MFDFICNLEIYQLVTLCIAAVLIGINKTAIPGLGVLPVVMLTMAFETKMSTGVQLGMLALADVIAVAYYRRNADWKFLLRLFPWALVGLAVGSVILRFIPTDGSVMKRVIGGIVLALMVLGFVRKRLAPEKIPAGTGWAAFYGILMGSTTQLANAAGPISSLYLQAMKLPKEKYMGCCAWYFLILNWIKLPIFAWEGRVTMESVKLDLCMIPLIILGGVLGIVLLKKMSQQLFENIVLVLVVVAAIRLLWG
ncbi:MAG: sulfite exporter TauE/SafE family protein [Lentisphaerae bacterium]|nr:sulfite exporter TauE/SafE family protein [Lentisphaerota bacterium]MBQ9804873.1 sulfite exporter TauE/SafE family protein [Lentisphaeria bacterium]